jgi:hypothetical protein
MGNNITQRLAGIYYSLNQPSYIIIHDLLGSAALSLPLEQGTFHLPINISTLENGIYFYEVKMSGEKRFRGKFIVINKY